MLDTTPAVGLLRSSPIGQFRVDWPRVIAAFESSWVAYPLLFILQFKVVWGIWAVCDVPLGDTACYFTESWLWYSGGEVNIAWSPLYTSFYGSFLFLNSDPIWATFAHRIVIVLTATMLVLAVFRQLLPASIAWLCAAWWGVLPIVFNTLYEVHLFATIPVLTAWLLVLTATGPWRRAAALGIFAASAVLVRNELSVPTGVLGSVLAIHELRRLRRGEGMDLWRTLAAYATAMCLAAGLCGIMYAVSVAKYPDLAPYLKEKHTLNMAQVYAYGYQQRHPEWTHSPWTESTPLIEQTFGSTAPTLREMIAANPDAVAEHFAWNAALTPSGLQLLLFHHASGSVTPDYDGRVTTQLSSRLATVLTAGLLALWAVGLRLLWCGRRDWWPNWISGRALGWGAMLAVATVVPLVILTQRPRPSYLFTFAVLLMAITGMCIYAVTTRWRLTGQLRSVAPLVMVGLVLFVPRYFVLGKHTKRPIANSVERLLPYCDAITAPGIVTLVPDRASVGYYIHPASRDRKLQATREFPQLVARVSAGDTFATLLARHNVDYAYLDERSLGWLEASTCDDAREFVNGRGAPGWELIAAGNAPDDRWRLYRQVK